MSLPARNFKKSGGKFVNFTQNGGSPSNLSTPTANTNAIREQAETFLGLTAKLSRHAYLAHEGTTREKLVTTNLMSLNVFIFNIYYK
jgi:hypothetical protein